jgi:hypothetical protein
MLPEVYKRVGDLLRKDYDPEDERVYLKLWEKIERGGKTPRRPEVNEEERKRKITGKLQKAIKDHGCRTKPTTIIDKAGVNRNLGLKCLRELEKTGEYTGFSRRRRR